MSKRNPTHAADQPPAHTTSDDAPTGAGTMGVLGANNEALGGLEKLDALARSGNRDAVRMFHGITCAMVKRINEHHLGHAASVLEWPVLLPQDREKRLAVTKAANAMLIGSVKGGGEGVGKGAGENLSPGSDKGFALRTLQRTNYARACLRSTDLAMLDEEGGITNADPALLPAIRDLPDYCPETREQWISVMVQMLEVHPNLIPDAIKGRNTTLQRVKGKDRTKHRGAMGVVRKLLTRVLDKVSAVPGIFGDFVGDK